MKSEAGTAGIGIRIIETALQKRAAHFGQPFFNYLKIIMSVAFEFCESESALQRSEVTELAQSLLLLMSVVKQGSNISFVHIFSGVVFCTGVNVGNRLAFPGFVG